MNRKPSLTEPRTSERPFIHRNGGGYMGDSHESLRMREVFKYYHPPPNGTKRRDLVSAPGGEGPTPNAAPEIDSSLVSSHDPVLACFANLAARMLNCRRSMITMVAGANAYVLAEATRSLSITRPHTCEPGDEIWVGGGTIVPTAGSLCETTVSLLPPPDMDKDFLMEINDLSKDPQYYNAEFVVRWPHKRFYGATPLRTRNGVSIGTLCVFDDKPRPNGLTEEERMTLGNLGETVMNYLQVKQGDRDLRKGKVMEMGLSRFIAEGSVPGEGFEITERRDGRLWSEKILEQRRIREMERKRRAQERRAVFQERKFEKMMQERERQWQREMEGARQQCANVEKHPLSVGAPQTDLPTDIVDAARKRWQSAPLERLFEGSTPSISIATPPQPSAFPPPPSVDEDTELSLVETMMHSSARRPPIPSTTPSFLHDQLLTPLDSNRSCLSKSGDSTCFDSVSVSSAQSSADSIEGPRRRRSEYEQTTTFEPHFRAMFFRAASLIRNAIDANVVFLDGDLEGFFGVEDCDRPTNYGYAHISTDKESEVVTRAERSKACRRKSGILGYATAGGSSNTPANLNAADTVESLGFDVSELNEEYLNQLVEENAQGRILTHFEGFVAEDGRGNQTDAILQRFLPGAKSVILVPLVDRNRKLFAVCFAWTCCETRSFCGDVEGSFVNSVTNTIISETTRLNILNADKAKGEFISSISHELRSPLHGILASAEFLSESNLDSYQRSFVDTVITCGKTLLDTINHVLDFQKLSYLQDIKVSKSGTADPGGDKISGAEETKLHQVKQLVDVDLSNLVQDIVDGVCLGAGFRASSDRDDSIGGTAVYHEDDKHLTTIVDIDRRDTGWEFSLNPAGIKRVINNITGNAIKYTESGWVRVRLRADEISNDKFGNKRGMVKISVSDSGKGISRCFLKTKLFTPFSQENPLAPGAGLGMSIVHQIVGAMDGKIDVKSQLGKGTKVTVKVPMIYRPKPLGLDEVADVRDRVSGMKALMVGFETIPHIHGQRQRDAADLLRGSVMRYASENLGLDVLRVDNAQPDIVIANEMTDEVVHEIYSLDHKPLVIFLCRHPPRDGGASQLAGYASTFIRKPCGPTKFARALSFCLSEKQRQIDSGYETAPEEFWDVESATGGEPRTCSCVDLRVGMTCSCSNSNDLEMPETPPSGYSENIVSFFGDKLATWCQWRSHPDLQKEAKETASHQIESEHLRLRRLTDSPKNTPKPFKPTILAVEDNAINLMLLTTFLEKKGYKFDKAADGLEALQKVQQKPGGYDVILMDLQMPVMSGIESTREIRRHEESLEGQKSFVVALTGLAAVSDQEEAYAAGIDSFMVKPVNFKELERTLIEGLGCRLN